MGKRIAVLLLGFLFLAPICDANAALFTLSGVKKASQIQFYHVTENAVWLDVDYADNNGTPDSSEWTISDDYTHGAVMSANTNWKAKTVNVKADFAGDSYKFAIFKDNGKLKSWGEIQGETVTYNSKRAWKTQGWGNAKWTAPDSTSTRDVLPLTPGGFDGERPNNGPAPIPEPATMLLLGSGLIGLATAARNKFKK